MKLKIAFKPGACSTVVTAACLAALISLSQPSLASVELAPSQPAVGEVTMVLGKAFLVDSETGQKHRITNGMSVTAKSRIETRSSGFVHVRFVDQALVSVRSSSVLDILEYQYNATDPAASSVKFNLEEGVARSISGKAAKSARQNYRMNTPIAAIGVRGTDFVVRVSSDTVRAMVNEGAIVVAPFSSDCQAAAFGPCSASGLELGEGTAQFVQVTTVNGPQLLAMPGNGIEQALLAGSTELTANVSSSANTDEADQDNEKLYRESITSRVLVPKIKENKQPKPVENTIVTPKPVVEFTPVAAVAKTELLDNTLVWGRFSERYAAIERISVPYDDAKTAGLATTVGNDGYILFRHEAGPNIVKPGLGEVAFSLNQAQAYYTESGTRKLMNVLGGSLSIDFDNNTFATSLNLFHDATQGVLFVDSGRVYPGGYFHSRGDTQAMAGAASLDGTEAGYFFEKDVGPGSVDGLTLWNSAP